MKKSLLLCLLLASASQAQEQSISCWNGHASMYLRLDDQGLLKGENSAPYYSYRITAGGTGDQQKLVTLVFDICRNGACHQEKVIHYINPAYGLQTEYSATLTPPRVYNDAGNYHDSFTITIPEISCKISVTDTINIR